jgi:hypothetical protein
LKSAERNKTAHRAGARALALQSVAPVVSDTCRARWAPTYGCPGGSAVVTSLKFGGMLINKNVDLQFLMNHWNACQLEIRMSSISLSFNS